MTNIDRFIQEMEATLSDKKSRKYAEEVFRKHRHSLELDSKRLKELEGMTNKLKGENYEILKRL